MCILSHVGRWTRAQCILSSRRWCKLLKAYKNVFLTRGFWLNSDGRDGPLKQPTSGRYEGGRIVEYACRKCGRRIYIQEIGNGGLFNTIACCAACILLRNCFRCSLLKASSQQSNFLIPASDSFCWALLSNTKFQNDT